MVVIISSHSSPIQIKLKLKGEVIESILGKYVAIMVTMKTMFVFKELIPIILWKPHLPLLSPPMVVVTSNGGPKNLFY
jgi:hypothetical protein